MTRLERARMRLLQAGDDRAAALAPLMLLIPKANAARLAYEHTLNNSGDMEHTKRRAALEVLMDQTQDADAELNGAIADLEAKQKAMLRAQAEFHSSEIAQWTEKARIEAEAQAAPNVVKLGKETK